ncbi:UDP-N-acetylmuramoyl-L-alanyl-D-glutamate--2,6-diaminopimelate ligase [Leifsonia sp. H3M29-4]|uniref:UDP-N-acetylmuramoyl-L-alanyl-D-glutamate--2, 6-diaminopimelate ligase n=1 Tax=Salinibacterium metalliresistens TaxID=3031321 RepID=UPI0023DC686E|nr:UDP-N-acetylmuramoyl-L-alanyl-D-glutamate--2,6-diaminopimelate ligase [Salinibacterium metalliresistens]MDF1479070.1 UDP-N-acetylmuramoyl-L-alanyl-D-glutamate--2,6-diaminopimelate ligase [Salinibacterium metalliresistens]
MAARLSTLLATLPPGMLLDSNGDAEVTAPVVEASGEVHPGAVFVARVGLGRDGHDFIPAAIAAGAVAIVGEREISGLAVPYARVRDAQQAVGYLAAEYHGNPSRHLTVVGVTGTDGKTTTSTLVRAVLEAGLGRRVGLMTTLNADTGDATTDVGLHVTTPGAPQVQSLLAQMVRNGLTHVVVEMTSHGLAQGRLNGVEVDAAVMTNLTHEHLDYHGTFEAYRDAKGILFERAAGGIAVVNADDENAGYFAELAAGATVLRYGMDDAAQTRAEAVEYGPRGTRFTVGGHPFRTALLGRFNVSNVLAAITLGRAFGFDDDAIQRGLDAVVAIDGRLERIDEGQPFTAIVDFAHTPNSLGAVLGVCRQMLGEGGRLIVVFGSAGLRDREKRALMAKVAVAQADLTVLTAEDPRTESLDEILAEMDAAATAAGSERGRTHVVVPDRGAAILYACEQASAGDLVIACGKGHEQSMAFGTTEYPWDDREAMRSALRGTALATLPTAD